MTVLNFVTIISVNHDMISSARVLSHDMSRKINLVDQTHPTSIQLERNFTYHLLAPTSSYLILWSKS